MFALLVATIVAVTPGSGTQRDAARSQVRPHAADIEVQAGAAAAEKADRVVRPTRPVHTYSIVARDPKTGEMGVAVQSHWFSVGSIVAWAEAGVGAVATQSFVDPAYGPRGLNLMRSGLSAKQALSALLGVDQASAVRQVAFVDAGGQVATHTGASCIESAGHHVGKGYSVQANMMLNDRVVPAMVVSFEKSRGPLAERMLAALEAAQLAGGDIRGRQSAAVLVVKPKAGVGPWEDRTVDLRVDDHATPLRELRRLLGLHRAYEHMNAGDVAIEHKDMKAALRHYRAAAKLAPDSLEMVYWHAVTLASNKRVKQSLPLFRRVFGADPNWRELTRRLPKAGIIEAPIVEQILREVP